MRLLSCFSLLYFVQRLLDSLFAIGFVIQEIVCVLSLRGDSKPFLDCRPGPDLLYPFVEVGKVFKVNSCISTFLTWCVGFRLSSSHVEFQLHDTSHACVELAQY